MFKAYLNGECFYDDRLEEKNISNIKVTLEENKAGSFEFTLYPDHPYYSAFEKLNAIVTVEQNGTIIFRGRVLESEESFYKERMITCEGEYAFFNDGILYPFGAEPVDATDDYEGVEGTVYTPIEIFTQIITDYNSQVPEERQFLIGNISITDSDKDISYYNTEFTKSIDALDDLLEQCGGHFIFRHEESGVYIDWTENYPEIDQSVDFGINLLDLTQNIQADEVVTGILAHGDTDENRNVPSNISFMSIPTTDIHMQMGIVPSAPDESRTEQFGEYGIYLVNVPLYQKYGLILEERSYDGYPADWVDQLIEDVDNLTGLGNSIEITAVDMSALKDIEFFQLGKSVIVKSGVHGLDSTYDITKIEIDLQDPSSNKFTLGKVIPNFVEQVVQGDKIKPVDGQSIKVVSYRFTYAVSDSGTTRPPVEEFSENYTPVQGKWIWTRVTTVFNDGTQTDCYYPSYQGEDAKVFRIKSNASVVVRNDRSTDAQTLTFTAEISGYPNAIPRWYIEGELVGEGGTYIRSIPYKNAEGFSINLYDNTTLMDTLNVSVVDKTGGSMYLGAYDNAVPTQTTEGESLIKGDYFLATGTFGAYITGEPYVFNGESFVAIILGTNVTPAEYGDIMSTALDDALDSNAVENSKFFSWFRRLATKEIFARYMVAHNLSVAKGNFSFNVRTTDDEGNELESIVWEIKFGDDVILRVEPESGTIYSNNGNFKILPDGTIIAINGFFSGEFDCEVIKTELSDVKIVFSYTFTASNASNISSFHDSIIEAFSLLDDPDFNSLEYQRFFRATCDLIPELAYIEVKRIGPYSSSISSELLRFYDRNRNLLNANDYFTTINDNLYYLCESQDSSYNNYIVAPLPVTVNVIEGGNILVMPSLKIGISDSELNDLPSGEVYADSDGTLKIKIGE